MELIEALQFEALRKAHMVASAGGLHRDVRWVHLVVNVYLHDNSWVSLQPGLPGGG